MLSALVSPMRLGARPRIAALLLTSSLPSAVTQARVWYYCASKYISSYPSLSSLIPVDITVARRSISKRTSAHSIGPETGIRQAKWILW